MSGDVHLTVIDPGLMEAGGHHAGFAMNLAKSVAREKRAQVKVYCHQEINSGLVKVLSISGICTHPVFQSNFYEHYDDDTNSAVIKSYIHQLCCEYIEVFTQLTPEDSDQHNVIFYPCLNWEHACALAMALEHQKRTAEIFHHVVCAMYNPGINRYFESLCPTKRMNFHLGFNALIKHSTVSIYTSDYELSRIYRYLLSSDHDLQVHPCYLADWSKLESRPPHQPHNRVVLYLGDAKEEKGFKTLPQLIIENLHLLSDNDCFVVQYTLPWEYPALASTVEWLEDFSASDDRLELHKKFWNYDTLVQQLSTASVVVFPYDDGFYESKSSGFLWLVAWSNTPIVLSSKNWLAREATRLGRKVFYMKAYQLEPVFNTLRIDQAGGERLTESQVQYREEIYCPFWQWIKTVATKKQESGLYA